MGGDWVVRKVRRAANQVSHLGHPGQVGASRAGADAEPPLFKARFGFPMRGEETMSATRL